MRNRWGISPVGLEHGIGDEGWRRVVARKRGTVIVPPFIPFSLLPPSSDFGVIHTRACTHACTHARIHERVWRDHRAREQAPAAATTQHTHRSPNDACEMFACARARACVGSLTIVVENACIPYTRALARVPRREFRWKSSC